MSSSKAILACSQLTFIKAIHSQRKADFLTVLADSLTFFGGVPQAIIPDNMKTAVIKAHRYDPLINESLEHFASHYATATADRVYLSNQKRQAQRQGFGGKCSSSGL